MKFPDIHSREFAMSLEPGLPHKVTAQALIGRAVALDRFIEVEGFFGLGEEWESRKTPVFSGGPLRGRRAAGWLRGSEAAVICGTWPKDPEHPRVETSDGDWEYDPDHPEPFIFRLAVYKAVKP